MIPAQSNQPHALWPIRITAAATPHGASVHSLKAEARKTTNEGERKAKPQRPEFDFRKIKYTKKQETEPEKKKKKKSIKELDPI